MKKKDAERINAETVFYLNQEIKKEAVLRSRDLRKRLEFLERIRNEANNDQRTAQRRLLEE